jgi:hypothetical protein
LILVRRLGSRLFGRSPDDALRRLADAHVAGRAPLVRVEEMDLRNVELREAVGSWAAGTRGVIVDAFENDATVEIADENGRTLDLLTLPYAAFRVLDLPQQERIAL